MGFESRFGRAGGCPFGNLAAELATTDDDLRKYVAALLANSSTGSPSSAARRANRGCCGPASTPSGSPIRCSPSTKAWSCSLGQRHERRRAATGTARTDCHQPQQRRPRLIGMPSARRLRVGGARSPPRNGWQAARSCGMLLRAGCSSRAITCPTEQILAGTGVTLSCASWNTRAHHGVSPPGSSNARRPE
jgi:hypothetical protein